MRALALAACLWMLAAPALAAEATLSWNASPGATSYRVYRCRPDSTTCWRDGRMVLRNWRLYREVVEPRITIVYVERSYWMVSAVNAAGEARRTDAVIGTD